MNEPSNRPCRAIPPATGPSSFPGTGGISGASRPMESFPMNGLPRASFSDVRGGRWMRRNKASYCRERNGESGEVMFHVESFHYSSMNLFDCS